MLSLNAFVDIVISVILLDPRICSFCIHLLWLLMSRLGDALAVESRAIEGTRYILILYCDTFLPDDLMRSSLLKHPLLFLSLSFLLEGRSVLIWSLLATMDEQVLLPRLLYLLHL